jgi:hypothetical protein
MPSIGDSWAEAGRNSGAKKTKMKLKASLDGNQNSRRKMGPGSSDPLRAARKKRNGGRRKRAVQNPMQATRRRKQRTKTSSDEQETVKKTDGA